MFISILPIEMLEELFQFTNILSQMEQKLLLPLPYKLPVEAIVREKEKLIILFFIRTF